MLFSLETRWQRKYLPVLKLQDYYQKKKIHSLLRQFSKQGEERNVGKPVNLRILLPGFEWFPFCSWESFPEKYLIKSWKVDSEVLYFQLRICCSMQVSHQKVPYLVFPRHLTYRSLIGLNSVLKYADGYHCITDFLSFSKNVYFLVLSVNINLVPASLAAAVSIAKHKSEYNLGLELHFAPLLYFSLFIFRTSSYTVDNS